jgi:hypothetical protein
VAPAWPPAGLTTAPEGHWLTVDAPRHHEQVIAHMLAHPGLSYEDARDHVEHLAAAPPAPPGWPPPDTIDANEGRQWLEEAPPPHFDAAVSLMLSRPGMRYEDAYDEIRRGR